MNKKEEVYKKLVEALAKRFGFVVDFTEKIIVIQDQIHKRAIRVQPLQYSTDIALVGRSWYGMLSSMLFYPEFWCIDMSKKELANFKTGQDMKMKCVKNDFHGINSLANLCLRLNLEGIDLKLEGIDLKLEL